MTTVYKLTRPDLTTYQGYQYEHGKIASFPGAVKLCGPGYSHAYLSVATAVFHNPIHAGYDPAILWEAEGEIAARDGAMKVGCSSITLVKQIPLPSVTTYQRVAYGIACAYRLGSASWQQWADDWLSGKDRTSARAARAAAGAAAAWAAWAAARAAKVDILACAEWALTASDPFVLPATLKTSNVLHP